MLLLVVYVLTQVITANAASVGDTLLGVPLLCSTGQHADAANLLQDAGLWCDAFISVCIELRFYPLCLLPASQVLCFCPHGPLAVWP